MDSPLNVSSSSLEEFEKNFLLIQDELNDLKIVLSNPTLQPPHRSPERPTSLQAQNRIPEDPNSYTALSHGETTSLSNLFDNLELQNPPNAAFNSPIPIPTLTHPSPSQTHEFNLSQTNIFNTLPLAIDSPVNGPSPWPQLASVPKD